MAKKSKPGSANKIAVIGLGRFGSALALELVETGKEVLGIDATDDLVQRFAGLLTHVVKADSTDRDVLLELGLDDFDRVVVAIGGDIEASILTASLLVELGVGQVWAKATSDAHGRILRQIGVHHVIFPEKDMGKRIAHQVGGDQLDYVEIDQGFVMAKTAAAESFVGKSLTELAIRKRFNVIVVATSHGDVSYSAASPDTVINEGDWLIVSGPKDSIESFCRIN